VAWNSALIYDRIFTQADHQCFGINVSTWRTLVRRTFQAILAVIILVSTPAESADVQGGAAPLAIYVDIMPNAVDSGAALLERYRDASRKQAGNLRFDLLQEIARPTRFALLEVWAEDVALDGHDKAVSTLHFHDQLKAIQSAPCDERMGRELYFRRGKGDSGSGTIYVITHVDVTADHQSDAEALLKAMSVDSANDDGNISYEVIQLPKPMDHHFTVIEEWASRKALDGHAMAAHTRAFRQQLLPMEGALYDERLYKKLD
jgi:quinol monooxygenase YgiN